MEDIVDGRRNGVTGTPTVFIDGIRYDGAWDFHSMLEAARAATGCSGLALGACFASLPASGRTDIAPRRGRGAPVRKHRACALLPAFVDASFNIGAPGHTLSLTLGGWFSEGLLAIFFLLVGLEIRRDMTVGALARPSRGAPAGHCRSRRA